MTLKEKFLPFVDDIDLINDVPNEKWGLRNANKCVEVADEYAIGFAKYVLINNGKYKYIDLEKMLKLFKKEKGL